MAEKSEMVSWNQKHRMWSGEWILISPDHIAFQTAVALAEYDAEKDEEGKIILTDTHFRSIVELSQDFKDYLKDLHKGDEGKRAERKYERLDTYSKPPTEN
jgi:hypothetical protein